MKKEARTIFEKVLDFRGGLYSTAIYCCLLYFIVLYCTYCILLYFRVGHKKHNNSSAEAEEEQGMQKQLQNETEEVSLDQKAVKVLGHQLHNAKNQTYLPTKVG